MKRSSLPFAAIATFLALLASPAMAASGDLKVGNLVIQAPWTRATPGGAKVGAGYLSIVNIGKEADRLKAASSPIAARVEIHSMMMDGGIMRMRHLKDGLELKAQSVTELRPGGFHIMLIGLKRPIKKGDKLPLRLEFSEAGDVDVTLTVAGIGATTPPHGGVGPAGGSSSGKADGGAGGSNAGTSAAPKGSN